MTSDFFLIDFLRDDAGSPLGRGMPSGRPLRADGQSHYEAWQSLVRRDPCSYCPGAGGTVDHIEPRSRPARGIGSVHGWINTIGACAACNGGKRDRDLLWFLHLRARAGTRRPGEPAHATTRTACRRSRRPLPASGRNGAGPEPSHPAVVAARARSTSALLTAIKHTAGRTPGSGTTPCC